LPPRGKRETALGREKPIERPLLAKNLGSKRRTHVKHHLFSVPKKGEKKPENVTQTSGEGRGKNKEKKTGRSSILSAA